MYCAMKHQHEHICLWHVRCIVLWSVNTSISVYDMSDVLCYEASTRAYLSLTCQMYCTMKHQHEHICLKWTRNLAIHKIFRKKGHIHILTTRFRLWRPVFRPCRHGDDLIFWRVYKLAAPPPWYVRCIVLWSVNTSISISDMAVVLCYEASTRAYLSMTCHMYCAMKR